MTYHPTARERLLQEIIASQQEQDAIARRRRIARRHRRNEWLKKHETGIALTICIIMLVLALIDWPWL
jgi:hypothetical protein